MTGFVLSVTETEGTDMDRLGWESEGVIRAALGFQSETAKKHSKRNTSYFISTGEKGGKAVPIMLPRNLTQTQLQIPSWALGLTG